MNYFFCDIIGTIDGCEENRYEQLSAFVELLENIISENKEEQVIFEFITSEDSIYLQKFLRELSPFIKNSNIVLGNQFSDSTVLNSNIIKQNSNFSKADMIIQEIKDKKVNHVYIADDVHVNHIIAEASLPNVRFTHFLPGKSVDREDYFSCSKNGILGLNECLEKYYYHRKNLTR